MARSKSHTNGSTAGSNAAPNPGSTALRLDDDRLERVPAWGRASQTLGYVFRPTTPDEIAAVFELARRSGRSVGLRGGGNSYGDAACNENNIVLDLTRLRRILAWDPAGGVITVEPGVTLRQLWEYVLEDGWWPPVSTGTMHITLGGGAAMNVHGKNAYRVGTIGDHILRFELMLPDGEIIACSREENSDLFYAAIGGLGLLGCFVSLTLQMKRIYSGLLDVWSIGSHNLGHMFEQFGTLLPESDYLVGWVDTTAGGTALGRGEIHRANYLAAGVDPHPRRMLRTGAQNLNDTLFGFFPRSLMWRFMEPFFNPVGVPFVNAAKFWLTHFRGTTHYRQPHAQFHFLLNYFPEWERSAGPGGLIQYQPFVPAAYAEATFATILRISQAREIVPYLGVLKRHRPDPFLLTHGLDGYSLALDYRVTPANRQRLVALCYELDEVVLAAGGRFYPAKDSVLRPAIYRAALGGDRLAQFAELRRRCDPEGLLSTNFARRVLDPAT